MLSFFMYYLLILSTSRHCDAHTFPTRRSSDLGLDRHDVDDRQLEHARVTTGVVVELKEPAAAHGGRVDRKAEPRDRKSTRLNSSHEWISYAVFCLKKKTIRCCCNIEIRDNKIL